MRISDWSSDVCSSDLAHRHLDVHISVREAIRKDRSVVVNCESAHSEREDEGVGRLFLERLDRDTGPACVDDALALLLLVATHVAALTDQFVVETVDHPTPRFATDERAELLVARAFEESHGDVVPIAVRSEERSVENEWVGTCR